MRRVGPILLVLMLALLPGAVRAGFAERLQSRIEAELTRAPTAETAALQQFYVERGLRPLWSGSPAAARRAAALRAALAAADREGLDPAFYRPGHLARLARAGELAGRVEFEFDMSMALLRYVRDLRIGRIDPGYLQADLPPSDRARPPLVILREAAAADNLTVWLASQSPQGPRYLRLKRLLAELRAVAARGGWSVVPGDAVLKPGMVHPAVAVLRRRLVESGDLPPEAASGRRFDAVLEAAVRRFQMRHGLEVDGIVGRRTLAALNTPVDARIRQVILNLERRRWLPTDLGRRYILVNIAGFALEMVARGATPFLEETLFTTEVVVGTPYHQTPVFSRPMTHIVLNPYWNVPPSIAVREILPRLRSDPGYLVREGFELLSGWEADARILDPATIDWNAVSPRDFRYRFRQKPGPDNALGRLKFVLPNRYHVYLHDTPARELFRRARRAFSHGCVRLRDPRGLAILLLAPAGWDRAALERAIESGERRVVRLPQPLPVHITYFTAWVEKDGTAHFRDDIYGRDARLATLLFGGGGAARESGRIPGGEGAHAATRGDRCPQRLPM